MSGRKWMSYALCAETSPDVFFPEGKGASAEDAKAICADCPVRQACLDYALVNGFTEGVWGGVTGRQLRRMRSVEGGEGRDAFAEDVEERYRLGWSDSRIATDLGVSVGAVNRMRSRVLRLPAVGVPGRPRKETAA